MKLGVQPTVIYGALPPWTKLNQAKTFNEMNRKINVMVATDAVGMGINLNIRRFVDFMRSNVFLITFGFIYYLFLDSSHNDTHNLLISPATSFFITVLKYFNFAPQVQLKTSNWSSFLYVDA